MVSGGGGVGWREGLLNAAGESWGRSSRRVVEASGEGGQGEGCLSIPDAFAEVTRPEAIVLEAIDEDGNPFRMEATGLIARAVQHELDHLDGVLFIDRISPLKRQLLVSRWKREHKNEPLTRPPVPEESKAES